MTTHASLRRRALALPEVTEQDHHGMVSFRVNNKIFATIPDPEHIRIMVDPSEILAAVAENPHVCEPGYWGKRLACVVVNTRRARPQLLTELLTDAWLRKAPKRLAEGIDPPGERPDDRPDSLRGFGPDQSPDVPIQRGYSDMWHRLVGQDEPRVRGGD